MTAGRHAVLALTPSTAASTNNVSVPASKECSSSAPVEGLDCTDWGSQLHDLAISKLQVPTSTTVAIVRLLEPQHLRSLHVPKGTRKSLVKVQNNNYRQLAKLLGWRDRHTFLDELRALLHEVWPDEATQQQQQKAAWGGSGTDRKKNA